MGNQIGGIESENITSSLQHLSLLLPHSPLLVSLLLVRVCPRHPGTGYPCARFPPALAAMGSQQSEATSNASQPVSYSARQAQLQPGAGRGGIAVALRWLGGKATRGGANPPAGKAFELDLAALVLFPRCAFISALQAKPFRRHSGVEEDGFWGGILGIPHPFHAPLRFLRQEPPVAGHHGKPWLGHRQISSALMGKAAAPRGLRSIMAVEPQSLG